MNTTAVPSTSPSFTFQGLHHPITNPLAISRRANVGLYPHDGLYAQHPHRNLGRFQRAHPEITPQERQYILHAKNRGDMDALSTQQFIYSSSSQSQGGFLSVFRNDGRMGVSSVPLSRTESCPLPGSASGKSQVMRRQHSSIDPSTIPEHLGQLFAGTTDMCLVPTLSSSFPPHGLPIQHISTPGSIPSALVGYLSQTFRDDPFSSVRGSACPYNDEEGAIENICIRGVSGNIGASGLGLSQAEVSTLPIHLSSFNSSAGAFDFTKQTMVGSFEQSLPTDLHLLPELTDTMGTPSSPAQMSRQPSCTTNSANSFNNFGTLPQAPVPMDTITAPEMGREWSDLSNPAIPTFIMSMFLVLVLCTDWLPSCRMLLAGPLPLNTSVVNSEVNREPMKVYLLTTQRS
ncbi:hypothetical protein L211DRAFT_142731 [Terfezia boudieri ATCC MYA-4762]|uniref:Uncharacterized protein n=1 Tax=Terfezia boudieri ATCC MYA-4762 TaxID=1051890 RepID=A0A3N4LPE4_9PEZI|nr:hypothetical protein L211DRAFT_142731 [Terfezia boudieri ATCC MYA-4762]